MNRPLPAWRHWFSGRAAISRLPEECIQDCSAQGAVDDAVAYWADRLNIEAPPWLLRDYLSGYGAWDKAQLCNHRENLERLLWIWACDCRDYEDPDYQPYLG